MQMVIRFLVLALVVRASVGGCPDASWTEFEGECYWFSTTDKTWVEASTDCDSRGGRLASVASAAVNDFIGDRQRNIWIGLHQTSHTGPYIWSDTSTSTYTKWAWGEPNNFFFLPEYCVYMNDKEEWNDIVCSYSKKYVCQQVKSGGVCGDSGWFENNGRCFTFLYETRSWDDAEQACMDHGAALASVHTEGENSFLNGRAWGDLWIGLRQASNSAPYLWSDDSTTDYTKWAWLEPNNFWFGEPCVMINIYGEWVDIKCGANNALACERQAQQPGEPSVEDDDGVVTPEGCKWRGEVHPAGEVWVQALNEGRTKECTCADPLPSVWSATEQCIGVCITDGTKHYAGDTYKRSDADMEYDCRCNDYGKERCK